MNDKTAKDMLDHSFRRQLLMDGSYGSLVFVATQSDVLQRSEVISSMRLPNATSLTECAKARCDFTEARIQSDFLDGLEEMGRAAVRKRVFLRRFILESSFGEQTGSGQTY